MFRRLIWLAAVVSAFALSIATATAQNLRLEIFAIEANNAVTAASAGKRPSQWEGPVMQLLWSGKAKTATCATTAVVWFNNMYSEQGDKRVFHDFPPGQYDLARYVPESQRIERTGEKVSMVRRQVNDPSKPPGNWYYQEFTIPLINGAGAVYLPGAPILASGNPIMGVALPTLQLRGLPQGNMSNVRWSTPANAAYGTQNELHQALGRAYKNDSVVLIVPPCQGG